MGRRLNRCHRQTARCEGPVGAGVRGFTLVELLVVIAIIGLIAGMLLTVLNKTRVAARRARAKDDVHQIETAWNSYLTDYRQFPAGLQVVEMDSNVMAVLSAVNTNLNSRQLRYMEFSKEDWATGFRDPWGRRYQVSIDNGLGPHDDGVGYNSRVTVTNGAILRKYVAAWSFGPDGPSGGPDDDVTSW